ncbi:beta-N-acetylhexosaminidase [Flavonifractor plautii]|uniref:Beta-N-acetylhexosaminidase n=1 Tax=Flavonifractor plautii TaxID=292800 RepID=A0AAW6CPV9_FLAPL|nr:beta-N-acetylhexosaminidase [Flavonifractor plautii]MDB7928812.1 beta-N-acetylhexosaminidase [Flavonifractor plautii]MDB7935405.1 beta-N-acetylhexosaminidase [Flavonifractor plautii]MDB7940387.1 beta-N-acetylhexosaminidase [Flavonifractor plautii]
MTKRMLLAVLLLIVFALPAGCQKQGGEPTQPTAPAPTILPTPTPEPAPTPTPDRVGEALAGMTVEQKAAQLLVAGIEGTEPGEDAVQAIQGYQVGGVILFGRNVESAEQLAALTNGLKELNGDYVPLFLCVDQEGGRVDRMPPEVSRTPSAWSVGQTLDTEGVGAAYGALLAEECAAFGFNMDFAPSLDIWSNPENTVIGDRAFGTDAATVTGAANETALGILSGGVIPVAKHFPGHGDTAVDSHYGLPVVDKSLEELEELELRPFRQAIDTTCVYGTYGGDTSIPAIMVAHILLSQIDPDNPASLSPEVVTGLLREEMGYEGVVCTDDLTMGAISNTYGMGEAAVLAVEAGCDLLLVCHGADNLAAAHAALVEAVESGRISMERLDESVYRVLSLKAVYGLSNAPVEAPDIEALNDRIAALERSIEADTSQ